LNSELDGAKYDELQTTSFEKLASSWSEQQVGTTWDGLCEVHILNRMLYGTSCEKVPRNTMVGERTKVVNTMPKFKIQEASSHDCECHHLAWNPSRRASVP
jgi:hypothetical protein